MQQQGASLRFCDEVRIKMAWLQRFKEKIAIRILLRSKNITMLAFKDIECDRIFIAASPIDPAAFAFYARNIDETEEPSDPASMMLERIYHSPDADKGL